MSGYWAWAPASSTPQRRPHGTIRIVTDSASDILPSHARALGVLVIPNRIVLDGRVFRDGIDITAAQYYAYLSHARNAPFTEPAPPADFYNAYVAALRAGAPAIVSIHTSSRLSQVVRHAVAARDYLAPATIDVIDSLQLGIEASRLANLGASARDVHERVVALLARTHAFVLVESLEPLRRSGRIGRVQELVGTLIGAHPILTLDQGEARLVETVRSRRRAVLRLCDLAQEAGAIEMLLTCGTSVESIAEMDALLAERYTGTIQKTWLGPAIGANLGPAIAVAVVVRE
jgi:DegV family protein with EDD domain